jgi:hypothetical protein
MISIVIFMILIMVITLLSMILVGLPFLFILMIWFIWDIFQIQKEMQNYVKELKDFIQQENKTKYEKKGVQFIVKKTDNTYNMYYYYRNNEMYGPISQHYCLQVFILQQQTQQVQIILNQEPQVFYRQQKQVYQQQIPQQVQQQQPLEQKLLPKTQNVEETIY